MNSLNYWRAALVSTVLAGACTAGGTVDKTEEQENENVEHEDQDEVPEKRATAIDAGRGAVPKGEIDSGRRSLDSGARAVDAGSALADTALAAPTGAGLPCEVQSIVSERCGLCHGDPPAFGAYTTLTTHADFHAPGTTDETKPYFELAKTRINDSANRMPPPSAAPLSASELATLNAWLDQGAPASEERCAPPAAGDGGTGPAASPATLGEPTARAYATLTRGELASVDRVIAELDSALAADPSAGRVSFYAGVFRLWKTVEGLDSLDELLGFVELKEQMVARLGSAHDMVPSDFRMTGFYALAQVIGGIATLDGALVEDGKRTLDDGVAQFPAYNLFVRASALANFASDSPEYASVIPDMFAHTKECAYPVDADGVSFHYPSDRKQQPFPTICLNEGIVPHAWEGIFISFGDMMLKSGGGAEKARALYRSAQSAPSYQDWPFAAMLEQRIHDAPANAEAFTDLDPFNDPPLWSLSGYVCLGCHQR